MLRNSHWRLRGCILVLLAFALRLACAQAPPPPGPRSLQLFGPVGAPPPPPPPPAPFSFVGGTPPAPSDTESLNLFISPTDESALGPDVAPIFATINGERISSALIRYTSSGSTLGVYVNGEPFDVTSSDSSSRSFPLWALGIILPGAGLLLCCCLLVVLVLLVVVAGAGKGLGGDGGSEPRRSTATITGSEAEDPTGTDYRSGRGKAAVGGATTKTETGLGEFKAPLSLTPERLEEVEEDVISPRRKHPMLSSSSSSNRDYRVS